MFLNYVDVYTYENILETSIFGVKLAYLVYLVEVVIYGYQTLENIQKLYSKAVTQLFILLILLLCHFKALSHP